MSFRSWWNTLGPRSGSAQFKRRIPSGKANAPAQRRAFFEALEDRSLLATLYWTGGGADGNWSTPANWNVNNTVAPTAGTPGTNDTLIFQTAGTNGFVASNVATTNNVGGLTGLTITVADTTAGGTNFQIAQSGGNTVGIASLSTNITSAADALAISAQLTGAGTATISGAGTVTYSANNTYTGATQVNGGTLVITAANDGGGYRVFNSALTIDNGATVSVNANGVFVDMTKNVTLTGGTLTATGAFNTNYGQIFLENGVQIIASGNNQSTLAAETHMRGTHTFDIADGAAPIDLLVTGRMSHEEGANWGGINKINTGTMKLANASNNVAGVILTAGNVIAVSGGLGNTAAPGVKIGYYLADFAGNATLTWDTGATQDFSVNGNIRIQTGFTATLDTNGNSPTLTNAIVAGGAGAALTKNGGGILTLSASNTYTGATTVNTGTLVLQGTYGSASHVIATGAVLELNVTSGSRDYATTSFSGGGTLRKTGAGGALWGGGSATFALSAGALIDVQAGNFTGGSSANEVWTTNLSDLSVSSGATFSGVEANVRVDKLLGTGTVASGYNGGAGYITFTYGVNNGGFSFGGVLADVAGQTGNFTKAGGGTVILTGANTYTGTTNVSAGVLQIGAAGTTGTLGSGGGAIATSLVFNRTNALTVAGTYSGAGTVTQAGSGTTTFSGNNSYTGATNVNAGTLVLQGTYGSTSHVIATGAVLELNVTSGSRDYATTSFNGGGTLRKTGAGGALWGGAAATFALSAGALIDIQGGSLTGGSSANEVWTSNLSDLNVAAAATFGGVEANVRVDKITGAGTISTGYNGAGYTTLSFGVNNGASVFDGVLANTDAGNKGNITKLGTGAITLTGANTYIGTTSVLGGTLNLNGSHSAAALFTLIGNATVNIGGTETVAAGGQFIIGQDAAGTSTVNVTGTLNLNSATDTLIAQNANNPVGILRIMSGGTVNVTNGRILIGNAAAGNSPNGALTLDAGSNLNLDSAGGATGFVLANGSTTAVGTVNLDGGTITTARNITTGGGNSTFNFNGGTLKAGFSSASILSGLTTGRVKAGGAVIDTNGFNITVAQSLLAGTPSGGLTKQGVGTLTITGANTYSGDTTVSAGVLKLGAANVIPDGVGNGNVIVNGTLDLAGQSETINGLSGAGVVDNATGGGSVTLTVGAGNATGTTFSGTLQNTTGSAALSKIGSGTQTLSGAASTYTGATQVQVGTLQVTQPGALGASAGGSTVSGGATLELNGAFGASLSEPLVLVGTGVGGVGALNSTGGNKTVSSVVALSGDATIGNGTASTTLTLGGGADMTLGSLTINGAGDINVPAALKISPYYASTVLADGAINYWRLSEPSGTTAVDATGHNNGAYAGAVTLNQASPITNDPAATSANFAGGSMAGNVFGGGVQSKFSVEFWINPNSRTNYNQDIGQGWSYWNFHTTANGEIYTGNNCCGTTNRFEPPQIPANTMALGVWQHFVYTFDNSLGANNTKFFKNGALVAQTQLTTGTNPLSIMNIYASGSGGVDGRVAELAVYNAALSAAQVATHFTRSTAAVPVSNLIKNGTGALTLSGVNTFNGITTVNAGSTFVNSPGSLPNGAAVVDVTVAAGATLGGNGTINGAVQATAVGTASAITPGATVGAAGTLSVASATLGGNAGVNIDITGAATADQFSSPGAIALGNSALTLSGAYTPLVGNSWVIVNATGGRSGVFANTASTLLFNGAPVEVLYGANTVTLQYDTTPNLIGTTGADNFRLFRSGGNYVIERNSSPFFSAPTTSITSISLDALDGNDTLTVDVSGGNPLPSGGVTFIGGIQTSTPGDSIVLTGGATTSVSYSFTNDNDGSITLAGAIAGVINYTGLEPITDNLNAADRVFTFTGGAETISVTDSAGANVSRIDSTLGEFVDFLTPTNSLKIVTNGGDTGTITAFDGAFNTPNVILEDLSGTTSTFSVASAERLPDTTALTVNGNAVLNLNGVAETVGSLAGSGRVTNSGALATFTAGGNNGSTLFSGLLTGALNLIKTGTGTLTITGSNTYAGGTTINGGVLKLQAGLTGAPSNFTGYGGALNGYQDFFSAASRNTDWIATGPDVYTQAGGLLNVVTAAGDPNHLLYRPAGLAASDTWNVLAMVRLNTTMTGGTQSPQRGGISAAVNTGNGQGYNELFQPNDPSANHVRFLDDGAAWGPQIASPVTTGTWYWMRLVTAPGGNMSAKLWLADGTTPEPAAGVAWANGSRTGFAGFTSSSGGALNMDVDYVFIQNSALPVVGTVGQQIAVGTNFLPDASLVTINGSGSFDLGGNTEAVGSLAGSGTVTNSFAGSATLSVGGDNLATSTFSGSIQNGAGTTALTKLGTGTQVLSGANTYTGLTDVQNGTLALGANNVLADTASVKVTSGAFDIGAFSDTVGGVQLVSGNITGTSGVLTSTTAFDVQAGGVSAKLGGSIGLTKSTAGIVTLSGVNNYTGATTVTGGTLTLSGGAAIADSGAVLLANTAGVVLNVAGGEVIGSLAGGGNLGGNVTLGGATLTTGGNNTSTIYAGVISGAPGGLTKEGTGTLSLGGVNTYTGPTLINNGTLKLQASVPSNFTGFGGAVTGYQDFFSAASRNPDWIPFGPDAYTQSGGVLHVVTAAGDPNHLLYRPAGLAASDTWNVLAMVRLNTAMTGTTQSASRGGIGAAVNTANGQGYNELFQPNDPGANHVRYLNDAVSWGPAINTPATTGTWYWMRLDTTAGGNMTAKLWPADGITPEPAAGVAWSQAARTGFAGITSSSGGALDMDVDYILIQNSGLPAASGIGLSAGAVSNFLSDQSVVTIAGPGFLDLAGSGETIGALQGAGKVTNSGSAAGTLSVGAANLATANFTGILQDGAGPVALTKVGSGAQTLSGANTYTGATTVTAGTLLVNGSTAAGSAVSVNSTGTLGGTGTAAGAVTVNTGGTIAPGSPTTAVGALTVGSLTLNGGTYAADLSGNAFDQIITGGAINLNGGTAGVFTPTISGTQTAGSVYAFISNTAAGAITNTPFPGKAEGSSLTVSGIPAYYSYVGGLGGNDFTLTVDGTPAPINGDAGNNVFVVREVDLGGGQFAIQVVRDGVIVDSRPTAALAGDTLTINGLNGNDSLLVDYAASGGLFDVNLVFNGGESGSDNDSLTIADAPGDAHTVRHTYLTNPNAVAGQIEIDDDGSGYDRTISYTGLEPVTDNLSAVNRIVVFTDPAAESIALQNSGANLQIQLTAGELTTFAKPTDSLTLNLGGGVDTLNLLATTLTGNFTVTGAGNDDLVNVAGNVTLAAGASLPGAASITGVQNINFTGGTLTAVTTATLTASGAITTSTAALDVAATSLMASAATGIDLDTNVTNLTATTSGAGAITLDESNGANVLNVAATNGDATVTTAAGGLSVTTVSASGAVTLTATTGALTDANAAAVNVTANVFTATAATGIDLDTAVTTMIAANTAAGAITLDELDAVTLTSVTAANGLITITAGGTITATNVVSSTDIDANDISLTATAGNIVLTTVNAGSTNGDVVLSAAAGNITGGLVTGDDLQASSAAGISLNTTVNTITATTSAVGAISLTETDAITLTNVTTFDGNATVTANGTITATNVVVGGSGDIILNSLAGGVAVGVLTATGDLVEIKAAAGVTDGDAAIDITASDLIIVSVGGIGTLADPLDSAVSQAVLQNSGSGDIALINTGALNLTTLTGPLLGTRSAVTNPAGQVVITTLSPLVVSIPVSASGPVILTATDTAGTTDNLMLSATVTSTASTVTLNAGDNLTINAAVSAVTGVTIAMDQVGVADGAVVTSVSVNAAVSASNGAVTYTGGDDVETVLFTASGAFTAVNGAIGVSLGAGADEFDVRLGALSAAGNAITINGGDGADIIRIGDTLNAATLAASVVNLRGNNGVNTPDGLDRFYVRPHATVPFDIDGDDPTIGAGDQLILNLAVTTNPVLAILTGQGAGRFTSDSHAAVQYLSIEDVQADAAYGVSLDATATGIDNVRLQRSSDAAPGTKFEVYNDTTNDLLFGGLIGNVLSFNFLGSANANTVTIDDVNGLVDLAGTVPLSSGVGNNTNVTGTPEVFLQGNGGIDAIVFANTATATDQIYGFGTGTATGVGAGEVYTTNGPRALSVYFDGMESVTSNDASTPDTGALTIVGDANANVISLASAAGGTTASATGYVPFTFGTRAFNAVTVNAGDGNDSITLVSLNAGETGLALALNGEIGNDTISIESAPAGNTLALQGGVGNDAYQLGGAALTVDNILTSVTIADTSGVDSLTLNDANDPTGDTVTITDSTITGVNGSPAPNVSFSSIEALDVTTSNGDDTITTTLNGTGALVTVNVHGANGDDDFFLNTADGMTTLTTINLIGDVGSDDFGSAATPIRPLAGTTTNIALYGDSNAITANPGGGATDHLYLDMTTTSANLAVDPLVIVDTVTGQATAANTRLLRFGGMDDIDLTDGGVLTDVAIGDLYLRATEGADSLLFYRENAGVMVKRNGVLVNPIAYSPTNRIVAYGRGGNDYMEFNFTLGGTISADFRGGAGDDTIQGGFGNDLLVGGGGNDQLKGGEGNDVLFGEDQLLTTSPIAFDVQRATGVVQPGTVAGNDVLDGGGGNDTLFGGGGNDDLTGGPGNDYIHGGDGDDILNSNGGDDILRGEAGNDVMNGGEGQQILLGGAGGDQIYGRGGRDFMLGGLGADTLYDDDAANDVVVSGGLAYDADNSFAQPGASLTGLNDNDLALQALMFTGANAWNGAGLFTDRVTNVASLTAMTNDTVVDVLISSTAEQDYIISNTPDLRLNTDGDTLLTI